MARIPREVVEAIRDRTDLVEVVGRHVALQKRGGSFVGLCPFHQEKTPSFHVIPAKAMYYCFGCQASGDAFRFLMEIEGLRFVEAVKELAGPAGVEVEERELTRAEREALRRRATLYDVLEEAAVFFEARLWTSRDGAVARDYLTRRGITDDTARRARLGWAPGGWTTLVDHLHGRGFPPELAVEAGLARVRERGSGRYDAFRERVVIPIRDERGRVIAFGGRLLEGEGPKYINSPETRLYDKGSVLYGLDSARRDVGRRDRLLVVEGYFDVISLHQAGFGEAVATCGTALTEAHLQRIRRLTPHVYVITDADEAGARAAERTLPLFAKAGIQAWRVDIPGAKDPDELVREEGPEAFEDALARRTSLLSWVAHRKMRQRGYSAGAQEQTRDELADLLGGLTPAQIGEVAPILRMDERTLLAWARRRPVRRAGAPAPVDAAPSGWSPQRDAVHLLWLLVHRYGAVADLVDGAAAGAEGVPRFLADHTPIAVPVARLVEGEPVTSLLDDPLDPGVRRTLAAVAARPRLYEEREAAGAVVSVLGRLLGPQVDARIAATYDAAVQASKARQTDVAREAFTANAALQGARKAFTGHARTVAQRPDDPDAIQEAFDALLALVAALDAPGPGHRPPPSAAAALRPAAPPDDGADDGDDLAEDGPLPRSAAPRAGDGPSPEAEGPPPTDPVPTEASAPLAPDDLPPMAPPDDRWMPDPDVEDPGPWP